MAVSGLEGWMLKRIGPRSCCHRSPTRHQSTEEDRLLGPLAGWMEIVEARTFRRGKQVVEEDRSPVLFLASLRTRRGTLKMIGPVLDGRL